MAILDVLGSAPQGLDLQAIAARVGMSAPGAYRALQTLVAGGLATQAGRRGAYRLGPKVLVLARAMRSEGALVSAAEVELRALAEETGETVHLAVVRDRRIWTLFGVTGGADVVAKSRAPGSEPYFHNTGRGKLYLAYLPREEAQSLVAATGMPKVGPNTLEDEAALWREVDEARRRGYATNRGERSAELGGLAVPVLEADGELLAMIGITVPRYVLTAEREAELAKLGSAAARRIERRLSGAA